MKTLKVRSAMLATGRWRNRASARPARDWPIGGRKAVSTDAP